MKCSSLHHLYLYFDKGSKMSQDYCRLLSELQQAKREINSLRNKNNTLTADNSILESNASTMKRNLATLKDQAATYEAQNAVLLKSQQSIIANYEEDILGIKAEIAKREEQLTQGIRANDEISNVSLLRKQIQCELDQRYSEQLEKKQEKIISLQTRVDQLSREKQIEKEKYQISCRESSQRIQQLESKHMLELRGYADRVYQESHKRTFNSDDHMLKKLRREVDELRRILTDKDGQIETLMDQKNLLIKEKHNMEFKLAQETEKLHDNIKTYKVEIETFKEIQSSNNIERQGGKTRDQYRQLKKLKEKIEDLHQEAMKKDTRIADLQVANNDLQIQLKQAKTKTSQELLEKHQQLLQQKQLLQKQIQAVTEDCHFYKNKYQRVSDEQQNLITTNTKINQNTSNDQRRISNIDNKQQTANRVDRRRQSSEQYQVNKKNIVNEVNITEERNVKNVSRISNEEGYAGESRISQRDSRDGSRENKPSRDRNQKPEKIEREREKVREIARKYLELQKKYENVKDKLKLANEKILDLIRSKIDMQSPPKTVPNMLQNSAGKQDPEASDQKWKGRANRWASPQPTLTPPQPNLTAHSDHHFARSTTPKERQFYEKSLSFKGRGKLKDLKCVNHEHEDIQE